MIGKHENYKDLEVHNDIQKRKRKKKIPLWLILEVART